jgi:hypothetical protein
MKRESQESKEEILERSLKCEIRLRTGEYSHDSPIRCRGGGRYDVGHALLNDVTCELDTSFIALW